MTAIPSTTASAYQVYAQRAASGHLASSAAAALAASAAQTATFMTRRELHATLGKSLDTAA